MTIRIVLAHDASAAWLESLPELSAAFRNDAEVDAFAERVAAAGFLLVVEKAAEAEAKASAGEAADHLLDHPA